MLQWRNNSGGFKRNRMEGLLVCNVLYFFLGNLQKKSMHTKHYWSQKLLTFPKMHCVWLTYTVQTLYNTVQDTDIYCTVLYITLRFYWIVLYSTDNTVRFYWHALYSTEQRCTFWLTRTVQHWTTLYMILTCTAHYWTVQNGYTD